MKMSLIFADGPTPKSPVDARTLGWETCELGRRMDAEKHAFSIYVHRESLPELVAYVRAVGRDCTYLPFGERQALIRVAASRRKVVDDEADDIDDDHE